MRAIEKLGVIIILIFLLLAGFASEINTGIKNWRTEDTTQYASVVTGVGATTGNVTLTGDLFQNSVTNVISITSNITGESPIASTYTEADNHLLVSALNASATRTLTVNYYAESENEVMRAVGAWLSLFIIGGLLVSLVMNAFKKKH